MRQLLSQANNSRVKTAPASVLAITIRGNRISEGYLVGLLNCHSGWHAQSQAHLEDRAALVVHCKAVVSSPDQRHQHHGFLQEHLLTEPSL